MTASINTLTGLWRTPEKEGIGKSIKARVQERRKRKSSVGGALIAKFCIHYCLNARIFPSQESISVDKIHHERDQ